MNRSLIYTSDLESIPSEDSQFPLVQKVPWRRGIASWHDETVAIPSYSGNLFVIGPLDHPLSWPNAPSSFFSENQFQLNDDPVLALNWLNKLGQNIQHLKSLRIFIPATYRVKQDPRPYNSIPIRENRFQSALDFIDQMLGPITSPLWCNLFDKLATDATGLEEMYIYWDTENYTHPGGGKDASVVRALARIKCLRRLKLDGYYAKEWPAYLSDQTGANVIEALTTQNTYAEYPRLLREYQQGPVMIL